MKIEIGESVCYSFLRHVKRCWLVQSNWKASENWPKRDDVDMELIFAHMKERFDPDGSVFKGTRSCSQFLKQGEIDVVGVGLNGDVHAMEVAYHEKGLNYTGDSANRVLKKLLRTMLILDAYHPRNTQKHIYFVSPKVHRGVQRPLEDTFNQLQIEYPTVDWQLITNEEFGSLLLSPTLEKAASVADTSELFIRSAKLLELSGLTKKVNNVPSPIQIKEYTGNSDIPTNSDKGQSGQIQPLVRSLMTTLLEDSQNLLSEVELGRLADVHYCQYALDLRLGGFPLLRRREQGRMASNRARYWAKLYGRQYYVTNNWWPNHHCHNARNLIRFVGELIDNHPDHLGIAELRKHRRAFQNYLREFC